MMVVWICLAVYLVFSIRTTIVEKKRIANAEANVIEQLKIIRDAQNAYLAVNGRYAAGWDTLRGFLDSGNFFLTEKHETIITLPYGKDSVSVTIDTLGQKPVMDSLFRNVARFDLATFEMVPGVDPAQPFDLWAGRIVKAGLKVNVIEVKNPKPFDPDRDEESDRSTRLPLRFGSRTSVTTAGNWE